MSTVSIISEVETPQGKRKQKSYTNINPNATNKQLSDFAVRMNTLTDNRYGTTYKIEKTNVDTESGDTRPVPTLEIWNADKTEVITTANGQSGQAVVVFIKYTGDGQLFTNVDKPSTTINMSAPDQGYIATFLNIPGGLTAGTDVVFTFMTPETDNYKAAETQFTVHITA